MSSQVLAHLSAVVLLVNNAILIQTANAAYLAILLHVPAATKEPISILRVFV